jgi:hypothetical protein
MGKTQLRARGNYSAATIDRRPKLGRLIAPNIPSGARETATVQLDFWQGWEVVLDQLKEKLRFSRMPANGPQVLITRSACGNIGAVAHKKSTQSFAAMLSTGRLAMMSVGLVG